MKNAPKELLQVGHTKSTVGAEEKISFFQNSQLFEG
jgi:hypothetical protein